MASPDQLAESLTKLYVSDIPPTATSEQLRECVEKVGAVDEVVVKHGTGQQGGHFGFVWTTRDVAAKLMSMTHDIDGVVIPAPVLARRQHRHARDAKSVVDARVTPDKIFVGGLSNDTKLEDYRAHFESFGKIKEATIMLDRVTNRSRGFGFVTFESSDSVVAVLGAQYHELDGRKVEVKPALPKEMMMAADEQEEANPRFSRRGQGNNNAASDAGYDYMYAGGEYPQDGIYPPGPMMMIPPGTMPYYAYGVAAAPMSPAPHMAVPLGAGGAPQGVPVSAPESGARTNAHSFVTLPHPMNYEPSMRCPMPMYPMMMHGVPVGGPMPMHNMVYPPSPNQSGNGLVYYPPPAQGYYAATHPPSAQGAAAAANGSGQ